MSPFYEGSKAVVMASDSNNVVSAAEERRCICIITDSTSDSRRRHTHTLPLSTTTDQLFEVVAKKLKYVKSSFSLYFSRTSNTPELIDENRIVQNQDLSLSDVGFLSGSKAFLNVGPLNGNKPVITQMSSISEGIGDEASTSATGWSFSTGSYTTNHCAPSISPPPAPPPPIPLKLTRFADDRRNAVSDSVPTFSESISAAATKLNGSDFKGTDSNGTRLIGLVNQAMTCYLNSLIQTLYMTPEFRNALYEWEYKGTLTEAATTMPFQLQRLFLALQTSDKQAVETTDLTKSFGWDSSEAWQQHDIQELCRVMFDALEQKFKESTDDCNSTNENSTDDSNHKKVPGKKKEQEIIKLYEGKMKDCVQCEECKNETSHSDTYLDIAIPIRPFGSSVAYQSVLEGLEAFVMPETLNGSNQYFCGLCNKKCDAKKGLKFTSFPYLLTLQLKRFDFDYNTLHRVKLNDRMYFPETLDLNSFIEEEIDKDTPKDQIPDEASDYSGEIDGNEGGEEIDTSSRDSGNDDDRLGERQGKRQVSVNISDSEGGSSIDEGIEIESQSETSGAIGGAPIEDVGSENSVPGPVAAEAIASAVGECIAGKSPKGKYIYELFSIMIHSGSAIGGHYYAYIKSFDDGQWYSFNDQVVSPISAEDIEKSYGGSGSFATFSSSYSSSTNAYMLMYRRKDPAQNKAFIKTEDLPAHIKRLVHEEEEMKAKMEEQREKEKSMCSIKLYCRHLSLIEKNDVPIMEESFEFHNSSTLREATEEAYKLLKLDECNVSLSNCRLVKYDHYHQALDKSLDDEPENQNEPLAQLLGGSRMSYLIDLLMETKEDRERFDIYPTGGVTIKVFPADYQKGCFRNEVIVRLMPTDTLYHLKQVLSKRLHYPLRRIRMAMEKFASEVQFLTCTTQSIRETGVYRMMKVYVDLMSDDECQTMEQICEDSSRFSAKEVPVKDTRLGFLIERTANLITVEIELPEDAPQYVLPPSHPPTPTIQEAPPSPVGSLPPLIDESLLMEVENCPKPPPGSARSTPSIDEGVGSYDGSSGCNSVPKTAECSACASPRDRIQMTDNSTTNSSADLQTGVETNNWHHDEAAYDQSDDGTMDTTLDLGSINYEPLSQSPARRNSEEEKSSPGILSGNLADFEDFEKLLGSKLSAAAINQSPTSSLQCEGGSSDSASETSGEFEIHDYARQQGDGAADSAGSCSTIDSTGTLCNNPDDLPRVKDGYLPLSPTVIDSTVNNSFLHNNQPSETAERITQNCYLDGPVNKEARVSNLDYCNCMYSSNETRNDATSNSHINTGPGYICAKCGRIKPSCINDKSKVHSSCIDNTGPSVDHLTNQDPESGEGMDNIYPLFSDVGSKDFGAGGDSSCGVKPKYLELSSLERSAGGSVARRRTESSSSVLSDLGYGDQNHIQHVYFKVKSVSCNDRKCQVLKAQLDKRMTVGSLKNQIQPNLQIHTRNFSIYRVYQSGLESELNSLNESFCMVSSDANLRVKHQRALRKDEHRCKIFQLNIADDDHVKHLVDWVVKKGQTIKDAKREICEILERECSLNVKPELIRLRKKKIRNPGKIFLDSETFGTDVMMSLHPEIFLEILDEPMKMEMDGVNHISVFCRRWRPSTLTLDAIEEVFVESEHFCRNYPIKSLKSRLSEKSGLESSDIEWTKPKGAFPCLTNLLEIHDGLTWDPPFTSYLDYSPANISEDGSLIFYRDKNEVLKTLSDEEKADIRQREEKRLAVAMNSSSSSSKGSSVRPNQRREKALKIYTVSRSSKK